MRPSSGREWAWPGPSPPIRLPRLEEIVSWRASGVVKPWFRSPHGVSTGAAIAPPASVTAVAASCKSSTRTAIRTRLSNDRLASSTSTMRSRVGVHDLERGGRNLEDHAPASLSFQVHQHVQVEDVAE